MRARLGLLHAALILAMFFLSGCAFRNGKPRAAIGAGLCLSLAVPEPEIEPWFARHHFQIEKRGKVLRFQAIVESEADRTALVGLTPVGSRAFSIVFQNNELDVEKLPFYPLPLRPRALLAHYQLMYWPLSQLKAPLAKKGVQVVETAPPVHERRFFYRNREIIRVRFEHGDPWRGKAELWQLARDFRLTVVTELREPLADSE